MVRKRERDDIIHKSVSFLQTCTRQKHANETVSILKNRYYEFEGRHVIPTPVTTLYLQADIIRNINIDADYIPLDNRFVREYTQSNSNETLIET